MSHTITITKLPDTESDDVEYTIGGEHEGSCRVWYECSEKHPEPTESEQEAGLATWHEAEHMDIFDLGWCVESNECGVDHDSELNLRVEVHGRLGTFALDIEWDGDGWISTIGDDANRQDGGE